MVSDTESRGFRLGRRATTRKLTEAQKYGHGNINKAIGSFKWNKQELIKKKTENKTGKEVRRAETIIHGKLLQPKRYATTYGLKSFRYKGAKMYN